ncbi:hypothetical protein OQA88_10017 [Cercophora sp. LCS_1]
MPKRKREDDVEEVISRSKGELHQALKLAKGFERQRQSKRLHDPKTDADKKTRIEKEVVVLKSLDLQQAARAHICSALLRVKSIAESPKLPEQIKAGVPKSELTEEERAALHNVTSALANRQEVRSATEKAIANVCKALSIPVPDKKARNRKEKPAPEPAATKPNNTRPEKKQSEPKPQKKQAELAPEDPGSDSESDLSEQEAALRQLDDLLASSSDASDSGASGAEETRTRRPTQKPPQKAQPQKASPSRPGLLANGLDPMEITDDEGAGAESESEPSYDSDLDPMEITDDEADSDGEANSSDEEDASSEWGGFSDAPPSPRPLQRSVSPSPSLSPPPAKKAKTKTKPAPSASSSTFLPSLMGGYISGSESEASDIEIAPKRNRRGQRARQALWEKKYKAEAKHLKNQQNKRDSGWDMKRGAVEGEPGKPWKKGVRNPLVTGGNNEKLGTNARFSGDTTKEVVKKPVVKKRDDEGPLHPSWEAKKKLKEAQSAGVPFQGKKIVFD